MVSMGNHMWPVWEITEGCLKKSNMFEKNITLLQTPKSDFSTPQFRGEEAKPSKELAAAAQKLHLQNSEDMLHLEL